LWCSHSIFFHFIYVTKNLLILWHVTRFVSNNTLIFAAPHPVHVAVLFSSRLWLYTSLTRVLKSYFLVLLTLRRNVPYFYDTFRQYYFASVSALGLCFSLTMMVSGFGPYHRLRPNDAPTECADIIPTPWAMMPALGFVSYRRGHELLVTPPPTTYLSDFFQGENVLCRTMKMHFYMNYTY
jgi:hypothetical protein